MILMLVVPARAYMLEAEERWILSVRIISVILIEQIEKYKDEIPFLATIKQIDKYYTFS